MKIGQKFILLLFILVPFLSVAQDPYAIDPYSKYRIKFAAHPDYCLGPSKDFSQLTLRKCVDDPNIPNYLYFQFEPNSDGTYFIKDAGFNKYIATKSDNASGSKMGDGFHYSQLRAAHWWVFKYTITHVGNGLYLIKGGADGNMTLNVGGVNSTNPQEFQELYQYGVSDSPYYQYVRLEKK